MDGGIRGDIQQQSFKFSFRDGKEVEVIHFGKGIFHVPGDGEKGLEIRRDFELLELPVVSLHKIFKADNRRGIEGTIGSAKEFSIQQHLGHFLGQAGMLLLIFLQGYPEFFLRSPEFGKVAV
jgi:hypothetical protein